LKRIRIGSVNLGKLPVGQWRYLRSEERFWVMLTSAVTG
jgi:23S rRNA pseudouridine2604 synthase